MKRLKQLREALNLSQQQLAGMLKTTQQTIARWESGKAEPKLASLRDMALIFGVGVDDLLGIGLLQDRAQSTHYHLLLKEGQDGFWGHVGLKIDSGPSKWFPVTAATAARVRVDLGTAEAASDWITFSTLANRYVAFRPESVRKVWLLDDACDGPDGDWENTLPYQGLPLEIYRAFKPLYDASIEDSAWKEALATLPARGEERKRTGDDPSNWLRFIKSLADVFDGEASETFISLVAKEFGSMRLYEDEIFFKEMHYTTIYLKDSEVEQIWADADSLKEFVFDVEINHATRMVAFDDAEGEAEVFFASSRISVVVMPLIDLLDAWKKEEKLDEAEAPSSQP